MCVKRLVFSGGWDLPFDRAWQSGPETADQRLEPVSDHDLAHRLSAGCVGRTSSHQYRSRTGRRRRSQFGARRSGIAERSHLQPRQPADHQRRHRQLFLQPGGILRGSAGSAGSNCSNQCRGVGRDVHRRYARPQCHSGPGLRQPGYRSRQAFQVLRQDKLDAELRMDAFNAFNHTNFGAPNTGSLGTTTSPNTDINSAEFGQVSTTVSPRVVQIALHVRF